MKTIKWVKRISTLTSTQIVYNLVHNLCHKSIMLETTMKLDKEFFKELGGALVLAAGMYVLTVLVFCL